MEVSHIEHLGIAVKSLDTAIPFWEKMLGTKCYNIEEVPSQKVKTAFFKVGQTKIELLESTSPDGSIGKFIEKRGEGVHHVAFAREKHRGTPLRVRGCRRPADRQGPEGRSRRTQHRLSAPQVDRRRTDGALRGQKRKIASLPLTPTEEPQTGKRT